MMRTKGFARRIVRSLTFTAVVSLITLAAPAGALAQQEVTADIHRQQAAASVRISIPPPESGAGVDQSVLRTQFYDTLLRDVVYAEIFSLIPLPPGIPASVDAAKRAGASALVRTTASWDGEQFVIEARVHDVAANQLLMGRRYRGPAEALPRIAHTIANDLVLYFTGRPGAFLTQIAFVSDRTGHKELWVMDYDGTNQRQITFDRSLNLSPDWSPDGERLVFTSFRRPGTSELYIINRRGGGRIRLDTGVGLNISPAFSPDGREIAFVGSVRGNPDVYVMGADGRNVRRLTTEQSIESTPAWSPTGRQISFTSSRSGSPQIYVMDAEGTNVRRVSFEGTWNDDAIWSPDGEFLAYTSRVAGTFQIRILNVSTGDSRLLAGLGSNEKPSWSPDGRNLIFASNRSGSWQIYRIGVDGRNLVQLTTTGNNNGAEWARSVK
jgi:TolB protein